MAVPFLCLVYDPVKKGNRLCPLTVKIPGQLKESFTRAANFAANFAANLAAKICGRWNAILANFAVNFAANFAAKSES